MTPPDALIEALARRGVRHLRSARAVDLTPEDDATIEGDVAQRELLPSLPNRHPLRPSSQFHIDAISDEQLVADLARAREPRLRRALVALFLRHPELAHFVPPLVDRLPLTDADTLRHMFTAAMFLQRMWRSTLGLYLGSQPLLPDHFGTAWYHLPEPEVYFGEAGLRGLAEYYKLRTGADWLSAYEEDARHLLDTLRLERRTAA